jgi:hypothetical protein
MSAINMVSAMKGQSVTLDAYRNIYLSCVNVWARAEQFTLNGALTADTIKQTSTGGITTKVYGAQTPAITESDILKGIVIYAEGGQTGLYYDNYYGHSGLPYELSQNPYTVDSSIGYLTGYDVPSSDTETNSPNNVVGGIRVVDLPATLSKINPGESVQFSIVNNGNDSLRLVDTANYKVTGFDVVYDATSALFRVYRESASLYYVIRIA